MGNGNARENAKEGFNGKAIAVALAMLCGILPVYAVADAIVSRPDSLTINEDFDSTPSTVFDGSDFWLFYGKADFPPPALESSGFIAEEASFNLYYKRATNISGLADADEVFVEASNAGQFTEFLQQVFSAVRLGNLTYVFASSRHGSAGYKSIYYYSYDGAWQGPILFAEDLNISPELSAGTVPRVWAESASAVAGEGQAYIFFSGESYNGYFMVWNGTDYLQNATRIDPNASSRALFLPSPAINGNQLIAAGINGESSVSIGIWGANTQVMPVEFSLSSTITGNSTIIGAAIGESSGTYNLLFAEQQENGSLIRMSASRNLSEGWGEIYHITAGLQDLNLDSQFTGASESWMEHEPFLYTYRNEALTEGGNPEEKPINGTMFLFFAAEADYPLSRAKLDSEIALLVLSWGNIHHFSGIQNSLHFLGEGAEIQVNPGMYKEHLRLDKPGVSIAGPQDGILPNCSGERGMEAKISYGEEGVDDGLVNVSLPLVAVLAPNISISGFTFQKNFADEEVNFFDLGVLSADETGNAYNSNFSAISYNIFYGGYNNLYIFGASHATVVHNFFNASRQGSMAVYGDAEHPVVGNNFSHNCFNGVGIAGGGNAILMASVAPPSRTRADSTLIAGNILAEPSSEFTMDTGFYFSYISSDTAAPLLVAGNAQQVSSSEDIACYILWGAENIVFDSNICITNRTGAFYSDPESSNITLHNNTFDATDSTADFVIRAVESAQLNITSNAFILRDMGLSASVDVILLDGLRGANYVSQNSMLFSNAALPEDEYVNAIRINSPSLTSTIEICSNSINGSGVANIGVSLESIQLNSQANSTQVNLIYNNISGFNDLAISLFDHSYGDKTIRIHYNNFWSTSVPAIYSYSMDGANATYNWFGDATGPYNADLNPSGAGSAVSTGILFDPWLNISYGYAPPNENDSEQPPEDEEQEESPPTGEPIPDNPSGGSGGFVCISSWSCSSWGECLPSGTQSRECTDIKGCAAPYPKAKTEQSCKYIGPSAKNPNSGSSLGGASVERNGNLLGGKNPLDEKTGADGAPSKKNLFDIGANIIHQEIGESGFLLARISLINFGDPGRTQVSLSYTIKDSEGKIVMSSAETKDVYGQLQYAKSFDVRSLSPGLYAFSVDLDYEGKTAPANAEQKFEISAKPNFFSEKILRNSLLSALLVLLAIVSLKAARHKYPELEWLFRLPDAVAFSGFWGGK